MKFSRTKLPARYGARVNWYVSPYTYSSPIHLFLTAKEAENWAMSQPSDMVGGVDMVASIDWFDPDDSPREAINRKRDYVDHRVR